MTQVTRILRLLSKSEDSEPTLYTDVIKIKSAEYDLNIINEDNEYVIP